MDTTTLWTPPKLLFQFLLEVKKVTNLSKPVTSLIMVQFSIWKKFWKALDLLYQMVVVSISEVSRDFSRNEMCKRVRLMDTTFDWKLDFEPVSDKNQAKLLKIATGLDFVGLESPNQTNFHLVPGSHRGKMCFGVALQIDKGHHIGSY